MTRDRRVALLNDEVLGQVLRSLRLRVPPSGLTTSLRVLASRERQRRLGADWPGRLQPFAAI